MLDKFSHYKFSKTLLNRRSFCELVMKTKTKEGLWPDGGMTDKQFKLLKHLAMRNLIRGCEIDDVDNPQFNRLRGDYNE